MFVLQNQSPNTSLQNGIASPTTSVVASASGSTPQPQLVSNGSNAPLTLTNPNEQQIPSGQPPDDEPLPAGWEIRFDQFGRRYYVDHNTRSTYWEKPTPLPQGWEIRRDPRGR